MIISDMTYAWCLRSVTLFSRTVCWVDLVKRFWLMTEIWQPEHKRSTRKGITYVRCSECPQYSVYLQPVQFIIQDNASVLWSESDFTESCYGNNLRAAGHRPDPRCKLSADWSEDSWPWFLYAGKVCQRTVTGAQNWNDELHWDKYFRCCSSVCNRSESPERSHWCEPTSSTISDSTDISSGLIQGRATCVTDLARLHHISHA